MIKCWAENYCKMRSEGNCNKFCDAYILLKALYSQSNIPKKYQYDIRLIAEKGSDDYLAFNALNSWKQNILEHIDVGDGLFIFGENSGTGKTSWAVKMMNYYFRKIVFNTGLEDEGLFIGVPLFLEMLRESYTEPTDEFRELKRKVMNSNLLILDDIGAEKPSAWVAERLYTIINYRVNNELSTIYTSNVNIEILGDALNNERIASRIYGSTKQVKLIGKDRRRAK